MNMWKTAIRSLGILFIVLSISIARSQDLSPTETVRNAVRNVVADFAALKDYSCEVRIASFDKHHRKIREEIKEFSFSNGELTIYNSPEGRRVTRVGAGSTWGDPTVGLREIPQFYDGTFAGDEDLNGRSSYVILLKAKEGRPNNRYSGSRQFPKIEVWVDKQDLRVARIVRFGHREKETDNYSKNRGVWLISSFKWRSVECAYTFTQFSVSSKVLVPTP